MNNFGHENASRLIIYNAAGIAIGMATLGLIKSSISDFIMPILFIILNGTKNVSRGSASFFQKILTNKELRFTNFICEILTWTLVVVIGYFLTKTFIKTVMAENFNPQKKTLYKNPFQVETFETACPPCPPCPAIGTPPVVADEMKNEMDYSNFYLNNT